MPVMGAQLEVLASWLDGVSAARRTELRSSLDRWLGAGRVPASLVPRAFEIGWRCWASAAASKKKSGDAAAAAVGVGPEEAQLDWAEKLRKRTLALVAGDQREMLFRGTGGGRCGDNRSRRWSSALQAYVQSFVHLPEAQPDKSLVRNLPKYLLHVAKMKRAVMVVGLPRKVNAIQMALTRMALFNYTVCMETVRVLGRILESELHAECIVLAINCLGDLYNKHTSLAEEILHVVLQLLLHLEPAVRVAALKKISQLIVDEYIKFRGTLLIFVLAVLCDVIPAIVELAIQLILKQRSEKQPILLRSCLLECVFVLNDYAHLGHLDMFGNPNEVKLPSPVSGPEGRAHRQRIYQFLVDHVETVYCYEYFRNVAGIADRLRHENEHMRRPEGVAVAQDFLFVLTCICKSKEKRKEKVRGDAGAGEGGGGAEEADVTNGDLPTIEPIEPIESAVASRGRGGRGRNAHIPTIEDGLLIVEKSLPRIAELAADLEAIDADAFSAEIDGLGRAMVAHFAGLTHMAHPKEFWTKFKKAEEERVAVAARPSTSRAGPGPSPSTSRAVPGPSPSTSGRTSRASLTKSKKTRKNAADSSSDEDSDIEGPPSSRRQAPSPRRSGSMAKKPRTSQSAMPASDAENDAEFARPVSRASPRASSRASSMAKDEKVAPGPRPSTSTNRAGPGPSPSTSRASPRPSTSKRTSLTKKNAPDVSSDDDSDLEGPSPPRQNGGKAKKLRTSQPAMPESDAESVVEFARPLSSPSSRPSSRASERRSHPGRWSDGIPPNGGWTPMPAPRVTRSRSRSQSQSESESDIERRAIRLRRKRAQPPAWVMDKF